MFNERFTRGLFIATIVLLAGNLFAFTRGTEKVAHAQETVKTYEIVPLSNSRNNQMERFINASASRGYRYRETVPAGETLFVVMEKTAP